MRNSTEDLIRAARGNAVEDFKIRFMQKWYADTPCFHSKELNLSDEFKTLVINENPSIFLLYSNEELDLEEKQWEKEELQKVLVFDWINDVIAPLEVNEKSAWLRDNIRTAMTIFEIDQEDLILCYHEGVSYFSKEWRAHFEKQLKV